MQQGARAQLTVEMGTSGDVGKLRIGASAPGYVFPTSSPVGSPDHDPGCKLRRGWAPGATYRGRTWKKQGIGAEWIFEQNGQQEAG